MKKITPILVSLLVVFLISFQVNQYFSYRGSNKNVSLLEMQNKKKIVKKVDYGEGEYEKVSSKWTELLAKLFDKIAENMTNQLEQIVILNYIEIGKQYEVIWLEMIKIEPPPKYKIKHENYISEVEYASRLCDSYLNHINLFDNYFKSYFVNHIKNYK